MFKVGDRVKVKAAYVGSVSGGSDGNVIKVDDVFTKVHWDNGKYHTYFTERLEYSIPLSREDFL